MCDPATGAFLASLAGGGAAAGATAAGATAGGLGATLSTIGTVVGIGGTLASGLAQRSAAKQQQSLLNQQAETERNLAAVEDQRTRRKYRSAMAQQRAELAGRGVQLDSPTAVFLGESAARELSFASQEVRSRGAARGAELSAAASAASARGSRAVLGSGFSAAGQLLKAAPTLWPGLYSDAVTP